MFPNVRLMIVAVVASVFVLSCGFGVFAALRVNHEPLARLPSVTAPVQLAADNPAPTSVTIATGASLSVRTSNSAIHPSPTMDRRAPPPSGPQCRRRSFRLRCRPNARRWPMMGRSVTSAPSEREAKSATPEVGAATASDLGAERLRRLPA